MVQPYLAEISVTAEELGLPKSTPTVDAGFTSVTALLMSLVGMLAVIFLIYGGFQYVLSSGDPKKVSEAKSTITYSIVGIILSIAGYAIIMFVVTNIGK